MFDRFVRICCCWFVFCKLLSYISVCYCVCCLDWLVLMEWFWWVVIVLVDELVGWVGWWVELL